MPSSSRRIGIPPDPNPETQVGTIITAQASYKNRGHTEFLVTAARQGDDCLEELVAGCTTMRKPVHVQPQFAKRI